ncbi:DUF5641 domain-containing protein [Trichonephila clavata]|uniref:DUF5641 domain-containing protein n=1 Tax=Trichonephila clavata TaxID=2740835 RepID=A0A8X6GQ56_TRICU|nr:DUF5641 domain-containing protein [Trichonephila clavata]
MIFGCREDMLSVANLSPSSSQRGCWGNTLCLILDEHVIGKLEVRVYRFFCEFGSNVENVSVTFGFGFLSSEEERIVKQCLRKVLGRALLDAESLSTVLIGIEAALNSRPLVYKEEIDDNSAALTPAHFLTGRKLTAIPSRLENTRLNKIYKQQQDLLDCFWKKMVERISSSTTIPPSSSKQGQYH